jgi:hypothetical protein
MAEGNGQSAGRVYVDVIPRVNEQAMTQAGQQAARAAQQGANLGTFGPSPVLPGGTNGFGGGYGGVMAPSAPVPAGYHNMLPQQQYAAASSGGSVGRQFGLRSIGLLYAVHEGYRAVRASQDAELAANLATSPIDALRARSTGIDRMTSGVLGSVLGAAADLTPFGPQSIRDDLTTLENVLASQGRTGDLIRGRREGLSERAAYASGGEFASARQRRQNEAQEQVKKLREKRGGLTNGLDEQRAILLQGGVGDPNSRIVYDYVLPPEVRNARRQEMASIDQGIKEVEDRQKFENQLADEQRGETADANRAAAADARDARDRSLTPRIRARNARGRGAGSWHAPAAPAGATTSTR